MPTSRTARLLAVSVCLNVLALAAAIHTVEKRGGWSYLRLQWNREGAAKPLDPDRSNYLHRESLFERLPKPQNRVVFVGDSLTQYGEWAEMFPGALNRGIGGDTSAGLLQRVTTVTALHPRTIFLMIGANDLFNLGLTPQQTVENTRKIIAAIQRDSPKAEIVLQSNLPTWNPRQNAHSLAVNEQLKRLANNTTIVYLDLYRVFLRGDILNPALTTDGGHLNGEGYLLWQRELQRYISRVAD